MQNISIITLIGLLGLAVGSLFNNETVDTLNVVLEAQQKEEKPIQVLFGNRKPEGETRSLPRLPNNVAVNVYDGGYQVVYDLPDQTVYVGFGSKAEEFTFTDIKTNAASTTP